jgi:SAM-dependent methyltransferase
MRREAAVPREHVLATARPVALLTEDGRTVIVDVGHWLADADHDDHTVVQRCRGPVLDVGCGPGRFVAALCARGIPAMGVDIASTAIALSRGRGVPALVRDVFAPVPGEGRWPSVLLMDGNLGIGGDPVLLLRRIARLLAADGLVHVEVDVSAGADRRFQVQFTSDSGPVGPAFGWAILGLDALRRDAAIAGYGVVEVWSSGGRTFASLARAARLSSVTRTA